jgi:hypothetical protein
MSSKKGSRRATSALSARTIGIPCLTTGEMLFLGQAAWYLSRLSHCHFIELHKVKAAYWNRNSEGCLSSCDPFGPCPAQQRF